MASGGAGKVRSKIDPGTVFGSYIYIEEAGFDRSKNKGNQRRVRVRCSICSDEFETSYSTLRRGPTSGCMSCSSRSNNPNGCVGSISGTFFSRLTRSAKARNKSFSLTKEYLNSLFDAQLGMCIYSGRKIDILRSDGSTASVDRIDNDLGYEAGNVQFTHYRVNVMRQSLGESRFLYLIHQISNPILFPVVDEHLEDEPATRSSYKGFKQISGEYMGKIRKRAADKGIEFSLAPEDVHRLWVEQGGLCAYSRLPIFPKKFSKAGVTGNMSVDRISSERGYVPDNIQLVLSEVNFMKHLMSHDEFLKLVDEIYLWVFVLGGHHQQRQNIERMEII